MICCVLYAVLSSIPLFYHSSSGSCYQLFAYSFQQQGHYTTRSYEDKRRTLSNHHHHQRSSNTALSETDNNNSNDGNPPQSKKAKSTKLDRVIDDFIGKKYGAGEKFYGKRTSGLTEDEYNELIYQGQPSQGDKMLEYDREPMKPNAILVVGNIGSETVQWIILELLEKGFSVRLVCEDRTQAIDQFGLPGINIDMIELTDQSPDKKYARAVQESQAIIFCDSLDPMPSLFLNKVRSRLVVMERLLETSKQSMEADVGEVQKVVLLSRYVPPPEGSPSSPTGNALSSLSGYLSSVVNNLLSGVMSASNEVYSSFLQLHYEAEKTVRSSGLEYVVVRAPAVVQNARPGAVDVLSTCTDRDWRSAVGIDRSALNSALVGSLDLAEAVVQSLLLEQIEGITYTVFADQGVITDNFSGRRDRKPINKPVSMKKEDRVSRGNYYGILSLDEATDPEIAVEVTGGGDDKKRRLQDIDAANAASYSEMRSTYMMRRPSAYRSQIEEDEDAERYWYSLLRNLPRD